MGVVKVVKAVGRTFVKHSDKILVATACVGVGVTGYSAYRATKKTIPVVNRLKEQYGDEPVPKSVYFKEVAPYWIPTGLAACATIGSIIGSNQIQSKRNAVLASLYSASELALKDYQKKVVEKIGEKKEREVRSELAQDVLDKNPKSNAEVIMTGKGDNLCYDTLSGRYFMSNYNKVMGVQNIINDRLFNEMWCTLNDVYYELGLPKIDLGDYVGFNIDNKLQILPDSKIADDGTPTLVLSYGTRPVGYNGGSIW